MRQCRQIFDLTANEVAESGAVNLKTKSKEERHCEISSFGQV